MNIVYIYIFLNAHMSCTQFKRPGHDKVQRGFPDVQQSLM